MLCRHTSQSPPDVYCCAYHTRPDQHDTDKDAKHMRNPITDIIAEKGWCVADDATGSNFFGHGLEAGYSAHDVTT